MSDNTGIEWADATWNPVTGCSKVSAACKHCYAERDWARLANNPKTPHYNGRAFTDVRTRPDVLDQPLRWQRPRRIFVNSMSDLFHESVPFTFIATVFGVMSITTRHTFQVLTKRPDRMLEFFRWLEIETDGFGFPEVVSDGAVDARRRTSDRGYDTCGPSWPLENLWLGVTVENQETAAERIPLLLETPARVRFVSCEPLLGDVDLQRWLERCHSQRDGECFAASCPQLRDDEPSKTGRHCPLDDWPDRECELPQRLDWVIVGGESGPHARPMHPNWVHSLRDQCVAAGVPFLFKQWGEWVPSRELHGAGIIAGHQLHSFPWGRCNPQMARVGKKTAGRLLDRREWLQFPEVLP